MGTEGHLWDRARGAPSSCGSVAVGWRPGPPGARRAELLTHPG